MKPFLDLSNGKDLNFIALAREDYIYLINIDNGYIEPIVKLDDRIGTYGQQRSIFFKKENFGVSLFFSTKRYLEETTRVNSFRMTYKQDFFDNLIEFKRLPE